MSDFVVRLALRVLSWIPVFFSLFFNFSPFALDSTDANYSCVDAPAFSFNPKDTSVTKGTCHVKSTLFPWGIATGGLLPWELQRHLREGYLWLVNVFANAVSLVSSSSFPQPSITKICPLDLVPESCDIFLMIHDVSKAQGNNRKKKKIKNLILLQPHIISNLHDFQKKIICRYLEYFVEHKKLIFEEYHVHSFEV